MSDGFKSLLFALILCLVCSLVLTGASVGLRPYQIRNMRVDRQKNVLKSVGLVQAKKSYTPSEISRIYDERIRCLRVSPSGERLPADNTNPRELPIYLNIREDNTIKNYIIPINTKGVWGDIKGYLAMEEDGRTIAGFTVYKHSETPGLGGEIEKQWFQENFVGKKIVDQSNEFMSVAVAKGAVEDRIPEARQAYYVDGISGATLTGNYLSRGLHEVLRQYEPVAVRFRQNELRKLPPGQGKCRTEQAGRSE
ncbi:MAG: FMN-binding protein [Desulfosudaceae bacterium]